MSDFQFRTRGQQSPQGKQRVYFTCHPDDFEKYFEEIQKEILDRQDCAVFYLEPGTQPGDVEDYELRLREMQLFVVPVTTKLLTKANRAMDVEVPFAFEHHIPVLPLMQESGLYNVFNKKFGDLQYLDKYNTDPTAISYKEKLTKYLDSVIVGDELTKKVRTAFDAYIFLSYRKKDRKYAQELMQLIHENDFCRDIAIWYDEFLTPGENFNNEIQKALEKCELFALTVTPNIIDEPNYILTTEYPIARDMGKKIIPTEMATTNKDKLIELYTDIPDLIAIDDTTALSARLYEHLKALDIRENNNDPKHNYYIGLAYLSGIDVEVNHERAIELITSSAKQEYLPAIKQLVFMYNNGEGVIRDYYQAIEWQEKLVKVRKLHYSEKPDEESAKELLISLYDLGLYLYKNGSLNRATETINEMLTFSKKCCKQYSEKSFQIFLADAYDMLGDTYKKLKNEPQAKACYNHSLGIYIEMVKNSGTIESRRELAYCYYNLGTVSAKLIEKEVWYYKCIFLFKSILNENDAIENRRSLAFIYRVLADCAYSRGDFILANSYYHKCLPIFKQIFDATNSITAGQDLSITYIDLGLISKARMAKFKSNETIISGLTEEEIERLEMEFGPKSDENRIKSEKKKKEYMKAKEEADNWFKKSLELTNRLVELASSPFNLDLFALSCYRYGCFLSDFDLLGRDLLEAAMRIWEQLSHQHPDDPHYARFVEIAKGAICNYFSTDSK